MLMNSPPEIAREYINSAIYRVHLPLPKLIVQSIFLCLLLLTNICAIIEIVLNNSLFELTGNFPDYLSNTVNEMESYYGHAHLWPLLPLLIFNIIFFKSL